VCCALQSQLSALGLDPSTAAVAAAYRLTTGFGGTTTPPPAYTPAGMGAYGYDPRGNGMLAQQAALGGAAAAEYAALQGLAAAGGMQHGLGSFGNLQGLHASGSAASIDSLAGSNVPLGGGFGSLGNLAAHHSASTPDPHAALGGSSQLATMPGSAGFGPPSSMGSGASSLSTANFPPGGYGGGLLSPSAPGAGAPMGPRSLSPVPVSRQRLFVVLHKNVSDEEVARLFQVGRPGRLGGFVCVCFGGAGGGGGAHGQPRHPPVFRGAGGAVARLLP
jgi:hypothetical protein